MIVLAAGPGRPEGELVGLITRGKLEHLPPGDVDNKTVRSALSEMTVTVTPDETLQDALEKFSDSSVSWAPVVEGKRSVGRLTARNVMRVYKATLERSVRRAGTLTDNTVMFESRVGANSTLADLTLRQIKWPPNTLVVSVNRDGEILFPHADTQLRVGDRVTVMAEQAGEGALRTFLEGSQHVPS